MTAIVGGTIYLLRQLIAKKRGDSFGVLPNSNSNFLGYYFGIGWLLLLWVLVYWFDHGVVDPYFAQKGYQAVLSGSQQEVGEHGSQTGDQTTSGGQISFADAKLLGPYIVEKVIDGDTIRVIRNGESERIRFIGINTPEIWECYSYPAKDYVSQKLSGRSVYLEMDATQGEYDKYGRTLAYVYTDKKENLNNQLVAEGYAKEYTYNTPYKYQSLFKKSQYTAVTQEKGLWGDCK